MAGRRGRRGSGPEQQASASGEFQDNGDLPAKLPQNAVASNPLGDRAPGQREATGLLAVDGSGQPEPEPSLMTGLLDSASVSALQLNPAVAAEATSGGSPETVGLPVSAIAALQDVTSLSGQAPSDAKPQDATAGLQGSGSEQGEATESASFPALDTSAQEALVDPTQAPQGPQQLPAPSPMPPEDVVHAGETELMRTLLQANLALWSYLRGEGEAALAHLHALSGARSPAEAMDLQAREVTRALGTALNLGQELATSASTAIADGR